MSVSNCKKCGAIFKKHLSEFCPPCLTGEMEKQSAIFRYVQENQNVSLDTLSEKFGLSSTELERMVLSGALGTASQFIKANCINCGVELPIMNRKGYFCRSCGNKVEEAKEKNKLIHDSPLSNPSPAAKVKPVVKPQSSAPEAGESSASLPPPLPAPAPRSISSRKSKDDGNFGFRRHV